MTARSQGLHHITTMASNPKDNMDFYTRVLGMRLTKKTVNFDDPTTYHLYYGDNEASIGTCFTVFPFPNSPRGQLGPGQVREIRFAVGAGTLPLWQTRLKQMGITHSLFTTFNGEKLIKLADPDGLPLALIESVKAKDEMIAGFAGITLWAGRAGASARTLDAMGFTQISPTRYLTDDNQTIDIDASQASHFGRQGAGSVHHIAFRATTDESQAELAAQIAALGLGVTDQKNRNYFRSIYFREPSGILYEIATDEPGFLIDETLETLGSSLKLPPEYEVHRAAIEAALPPLT
jgi:glyoxalase family protein